MKRGLLSASKVVFFDFQRVFYWLNGLMYQSKAFQTSISTLEARVLRMDRSSWFVKIESKSTAELAKLFGKIAQYQRSFFDHKSVIAQQSNLWGPSPIAELCFSAKV